MSAASDPGSPGITITCGGAPVGPDVLEAVSELTVDARLRVPDRLTLRLYDGDFSVMDAGTFDVGTDVTVSLASAGDDGSGKVFDGKVTTVAPVFDRGTTVLTVLALDRGCLLQHAPRTATYQTMSYGEIASKLAQGAGLRPGRVDSGPRLAFVQQSNETDWDFLWRLAFELDFEVKVEGRTLNFRPSGTSSGSLDIAMGDGLRAFAPRATAVQQADSVSVHGWDPTAGQAIVATASAGATQSRPGITRDDVVGTLSAETIVVTDQPVMDADQAGRLAASLASRNASAFVEGEGRADGIPGLKPGMLVNVGGVGKLFSGVYSVSGVRHVLRAAGRYETHFTIAGREDRSLLGLARSAAPEHAGWGRRIVVGVVTNNDDPDKLGRVRVKYPALGDDHEGWWARLVAPGAGGARGFVSLPLVGDEVLVTFEHGAEQHPYILGSVFNGVGKPAALATTDGSFALGSDKKVNVTAKDTMTLSSGGKATFTTKPPEGGEGEGGGGGGGGKADVELSATGGLTLEGGTTLAATAEQALTVDGKQAVKITAASTATVKGTQGLTLSGGKVEVTADGTVKIAGAMLTIEASGPVKISGNPIMLG